MSKKTGVLLMNLGTPDSANVKDVRRYLNEFLNDPRVIDLPWLKRKMLVNLIIVPLRAPKSAKEYAKLFKVGNGQSPLLTYGLSLREKVDELVGDEIDVYFAMRYQNPSMDKALAEMRAKNYERIVLFPLYPHYASSSTGSTIERAFKIMSKWWAIPEIEIVGQFYNDDGFIRAIANNARKFNLTDYDHVLFSYHGLPIRQLDKVYVDGAVCDDHSCEDGVDEGNELCYKAVCYETTKLIVKELGMKEGSYSTAFQSRLGKDPWIQPFSDVVIADLAKAGKKKLLVFSPAFVADCLETTVEIGDEYLQIFREHGGTSLQLVPSLNDNQDWVEYLAQKVKS
ncbi:MAG: ferrochelatase [Flavobacteriales bacterium]|nr:ferrochelatase [Flavobacteriales bacterium]